VVVEQAQPPGLLISNGEFVGRWGSTNAVCLEIAPDAGGKVSLANCSFWGPIDRCVWMRSAQGQFTASACHFVHWDNRNIGSAALQIDACKALVQGCSFYQDNLDVLVGPAVVSAILTANQAAGGFRVENQAGDRAVMGLNQADPIVWTEEARAHYRIEIGAGGDGRYIKGFGGRERLETPFRWSTPVSYLILPVPVDRACTVTLEGEIPTHAVAADSGLYSGDTLLAPLVAGGRLDADLPPTQEGQVRLELRCQGWCPKDLIAESNYPRTLGVLLRTVTVRAADAGDAVFDANTGQWVGVEPPAE